MLVAWIVVLARDACDGPQRFSDWARSVLTPGEHDTRWYPCKRVVLADVNIACSTRIVAPIPSRPNDSWTGGNRQNRDRNT